MAKASKPSNTNPAKIVVIGPKIEGKNSSNIPTMQTPVAKPTKKS